MFSWLHARLPKLLLLGLEHGICNIIEALVQLLSPPLQLSEVCR
jgi:hypothetical protein